MVHSITIIANGTEETNVEQGTPEEAQETAASPEKHDAEFGKESKEEDPAHKVSKPLRGDFFNTWGRIRNIFREFLGELLGVSLPYKIIIRNTPTQQKRRQQSLS